MPKFAGVFHLISVSISPIIFTSKVLAVLGMSTSSLSETIIFLKKLSFANNAMPMFLPLFSCDIKLVLNVILSSLSRISVAITSLLSGPEKKLCIFDLILEVAVLGILIFQFKLSTAVIYALP